jgi:YebC/PmpR family DNA-binding regulatory protein
MSGHNKWSTIRRKKAVVDAKRGAAFTKIIREIMVSVRTGGDLPDANPRLRTAISKAKEVNMPIDNIERAIAKAAGKLDGQTFEEGRYEGYGPGGVAVMVDVITDNKNRTMPELRSMFSKTGGNMGESGCVGFMFDKKGIINIEPDQTTEDEMIEYLLDYDVEDVKTEDGTITVSVKPEGFNAVYEAIQAKKLKTSFAEITYIPQSTVSLDEKKAEQCLRLIEMLEDQDDVQNVYSNYEISDEIMAKIQGE